MSPSGPRRGRRDRRRPGGDDEVEPVTDTVEPDEVGGIDDLDELDDDGSVVDADGRDEDEPVDELDADDPVDDAPVEDVAAAKRAARRKAAAERANPVDALTAADDRRRDPGSHSVWWRLYHGETRADIVGRWKLWFGVSGMVLLIGFGALFVRGLNMGIDFTGGTVWQVPAGQATTEQIENRMADLGYDDVQVQETRQISGGSSVRTMRVEAEQTIEPASRTTDAIKDVNDDLEAARDRVPKAAKARVQTVIDSLGTVEGPFRQAVPAKLKTLAEEATALRQSAAKGGSQRVTTSAVRTQADQMLGLINDLSDAETAERARQSQDVTEMLADVTGSRPSQVAVDSVGPSWGQQISEKARTALIVFLLAITLFITIRFELKMAIATVVALFHDLLVVVGLYALTQLPVTPATVVALLTMLGFSIYDGIVVFDRVNENQKLLNRRSRLTYSGMANLSLNQVLMRSLNTSITSLLPIISVLVVGSILLGASTLREFGVALFLGLLSGAYSSIFIATPLLAILKEREPRYRQLREDIETRGHGTVVEDRPATATDDDDPVRDFVLSGGTSAATPRPRKRGKRR